MNAFSARSLPRECLLTGLLIYPIQGTRLKPVVNESPDPNELHFLRLNWFVV